MSQPTINLSDARKEYLTKFIDARRQWKEAQDGPSLRDVGYWWDQMRKWGGLIDLTTRIQTELKGRSRR